MNPAKLDPDITVLPTSAIASDLGGNPLAALVAAADMRSTKRPGDRGMRMERRAAPTRPSLLLVFLAKKRGWVFDAVPAAVEYH